MPETPPQPHNPSKPILAKMSSIAILLAAGSGQRMQGQVEDKILAPINGQPALVYSLKAFDRSCVIDSYLIVYRDEIQKSDRSHYRSSRLRSFRNTSRIRWRRTTALRHEGPERHRRKLRLRLYPRLRPPLHHQLKPLKMSTQRSKKTRPLPSHTPSSTQSSGPKQPTNCVN